MYWSTSGRVTQTSQAQTSGVTPSRRARRTSFIGKEVDRLDEDAEFTLNRPDPAEYRSTGATLEWALGILESEPASKLAQLVGMSERRVRDIKKGRVKRVRAAHRNVLIKLALERFKVEPA